MLDAGCNRLSIPFRSCQRVGLSLRSRRRSRLGESSIEYPVSKIENRVSGRKIRNPKSEIFDAGRRRSEIRLRVHRRALQANFIVKVGAGGVAALADRSDHRSTFELFALCHLDPLEVGITCFISVAVLNYYQATEITRTASEAHATICCYSDLGSLGCRQVQALVARGPSRHTKRGGNPRHIVGNRPATWNHRGLNALSSAGAA